MNFIHNQTNQALADHVQFCAQNKILQTTKKQFDIFFNLQSYGCKIAAKG